MRFGSTRNLRTCPDCGRFYYADIVKEHRCLPAWPVLVGDSTVLVRARSVREALESCRRRHVGEDVRLPR